MQPKDGKTKAVEPDKVAGGLSAEEWDITARQAAEPQMKRRQSLVTWCIGWTDWPHCGDLNLEATSPPHVASKDRFRGPPEYFAVEETNKVAARLDLEAHTRWVEARTQTARGAALVLVDRRATCRLAIFSAQPGSHHACGTPLWMTRLSLASLRSGSFPMEEDGNNLRLGASFLYVPKHWPHS